MSPRYRRAFGESVVLKNLDRTRVELDFAKLGLGGDDGGRAFVG